MAIPITVLDCDLLLYGRGHRTLDRFKLHDVTDDFLMSMYGFPRQFIYYLVELLGAVFLDLLRDPGLLAQRHRSSQHWVSIRQVPSRLGWAML